MVLESIRIAVSRRTDDNDANTDDNDNKTNISCRRLISICMCDYSMQSRISRMFEDVLFPSLRVI